MSSSYYADFWLSQYNEQQQAKGLFTFTPKCGTLFLKTNILGFLENKRHTWMHRTEIRIKIWFPPLLTMTGPI